MEIQAQCETAWNTEVYSGIYKPVGAYGDYAIYEKETVDRNENWWYFHYDTTTSGWEFGYGKERVVPGVTLMGSTVSDSNKPGETSDNLK